MAETDIEITASSIEHLGDNDYYIRRVFNVLREHMELLEDPDYKRLYEEAREHLFLHAVKCGGWNKDRREWGYDWIEFLADLNNKYDEESKKFTMETVELFLAERKKAWNS